MLHHFFVYAILWAELFIFVTALITKSKVEEDDKVHRIKVQPENMVELYQHWTDQAFSGLFAAVASKRLRNAPKDVKEQVSQCSKNAKTVIAHAKCVSKLIDGKLAQEKDVRRAPIRNKKTKNKKVLPSASEYQAFVQEPSLNVYRPNKKLSSFKFLSAKKHKIQKSDRFSPSKIKFPGQNIHKQNQNTQASRIRYRAINDEYHKIRRIANARHGPRGVKIITQGNYANPIIQPKISLEKIIIKNSQNGERFRRLNKAYINGYNSREYFSKLSERFNKFLHQNKIGFNRTNPWNKPVGRRRIKREILHRSSYKLRTRNADMTPIGMVAKILSKALMTSKNKTEIKPWQYAVERIRGRVIQEKENKQQLKEARKQFEDYLFRGFRHENENIDVDEMMEHPKQLKQLLEIKRQTDPKTDRDQKLLDLLRDGVKLGYSLVGRNTSELEDKNLKAFSPRLLSVVPEEDDKNSVDLLSPSLFSLHSKGKGIEKLSSLPNLVQGFSQGDQQEWLNFIIEAAGVNEQIDNLEQDPRLASNNPNWRQPMDNKIIGKRYKADIYNKNGQPHYVTKENATKILGSLQERKVNTWEKLVKTYSKEQLSELNATGYTTLTKEQLYIVYGPSSPFNNSETLHRLSKANSSEIQDLIERDIHHISKQRSFNIRQKDVVLSAFVFSPVLFAYPVLNQFVVLTPIVFSPVIGTPSVLGPLILSPAIFSPLILSPRALAPIVLDPLLMDPIILSPMVLNPFILTPGVFVPIILNPFALSPFILSPQVFTPLILSPLVLTPLILTPMVGSPLVLSPFVLCPIILSPQALFALVLSPYAMSPNVESKLYLSSIFLSPSFLS